MLIVDLGCGDMKHEDSIGVDSIALPGVDIIHDLTKFPYPFTENSVDYIYMNNIIEHLPDTIRTMEEVHRILKPGGIVHIETVYWNHHNSYDDPQHVKHFTEDIWQFFTGERKGYYTKARFEKISFETQYDYKNKYYFLCWKPLMNFFSNFLNNIKCGMVVELKKI